MVVSFLRHFICLFFFKSPELGAQEACNPKTPLSTDKNKQANKNKESLFSQPGCRSVAQMRLLETAMAPTPASLPGESQGRGSLVAAIWGRTDSDTTEAT